LLLDRVGFELPSEKVFERYVAAVNKRYPSRWVVPFAKSMSNDDTAAFVRDENRPVGSVLEFHDFATSGYENPIHFGSLEQWLEEKQKQIY